MENLKNILNCIYGPDQGRQAYDRLMPLIEGFDKKAKSKRLPFCPGATWC